ncbi:hypothetical protein FACS1894110_25680 [Spirochaetia bacterium]|nr:hypothetical protein FACS1894110_25680 [Spirochaetia bacterium]
MKVKDTAGLALRLFIGILILFIIMNSCDKNNKMLKEDINNKDNIGYSLVENDISEEDIKTLLYSFAESPYKGKIQFLEKIEFGIPGGDNWLVEWIDRNGRNNTLILYLIKNNEIKKHYYSIVNFDMQANSRYDIMKDIPGIHIGNGTCSLGDFNGDGIDEVFQCGFYGYGKALHIWGYDAEKDSLVAYCDIPFGLIDAENGPAPVEFMTYKGIDGFKVYYAATVVAGGPNDIPETPLDNNKWFFYAWDEGEKEYIRIEEVKDGE